MVQASQNVGHSWSILSLKAHFHQSHKSTILPAHIIADWTVSLIATMSSSSLGWNWCWCLTFIVRNENHLGFTCNCHGQTSTWSLSYCQKEMDWLSLFITSSAKLISKNTLPWQSQMNPQDIYLQILGLNLLQKDNFLKNLKVIQGLAPFMS